jgi:hypothetical protein
MEQLGQIQWKYSDPTHRIRSNVVMCSKIPAYIARPLFFNGCSSEGYSLLLMRTRPGSTTVKASRSREPNLDTASIRVADLARRAPLGNLIRITLADKRPPA